MRWAPHPDQIVEIYRRIHDAAPSGGVPDFSQRSIAQHTANLFGNYPHPTAPSVTVNEYPAYARVAWMLNDRKPTGADVAHAAETLRGVDMSPSEFEHVWTKARPVANRLLGVDPTITDLMHLKGAAPQDIHHYYLEHPYPGYEEVTAGQMSRYYRAAEPIARQYGLVPNHEEVSRFAVAGYGEDDMHQHYGEMRR